MQGSVLFLMFAAMASAGELDPIESRLDAGRPMVSLQPAVIPAGLNARLHAPIGNAGGGATMILTGGAATSVLSEPQAGRYRFEVGMDYYLADRYRGLFLGPRATMNYWGSEPIIGGTNVAGGYVVGWRAPIGSTGTTIGVGVGMEVRYYIEYRLGIGTDGVQAMPRVEIDLSLPNVGRGSSG